MYDNTKNITLQQKIKIILTQSNLSDNIKSQSNKTEVKKMEQSIIEEEMEKFVIRVLKGGTDVTPQETAILPEIIKLIKNRQP